jgi:uncharacterized Zn finger protein (UPF0148 family)
MYDEVRHKEDHSKFRNAAGLLLKGGSLISESCLICSGVQIRFKDKILCINCDNEYLANSEVKSKPLTINDSQSKTIERSKYLHDASLNVDDIIKVRISVLLREIETEDNIVVEKQKADLLETYLRILEML